MQEFRAQQRRVLHGVENKGREALRQGGDRGAEMTRTEKLIITIKKIVFKSKSSVLDPGWKQLCEDFIRCCTQKLVSPLTSERCIFQDLVTAKPSILKCQNLWSEEGLTLGYPKSKRYIKILLDCFNNSYIQIYFCACFTTAGTFDWNNPLWISVAPDFSVQKTWCWIPVNASAEVVSGSLLH